MTTLRGKWYLPTPKTEKAPDPPLDTTYVVEASEVASYLRVSTTDMLIRLYPRDTESPLIIPGSIVSVVSPAPVRSLFRVSEVLSVRSGSLTELYLECTESRVPPTIEIRLS